MPWWSTDVHNVYNHETDKNRTPSRKNGLMYAYLLSQMKKDFSIKHAIFWIEWSTPHPKGNHETDLSQKKKKTNCSNSSLVDVQHRYSWHNVCPIP